MSSLFRAPDPDGFTQEFWDACIEGRLLVRRCLDCASVDGALSHPDIRVRDNGPLRHIFNYGPEAVDIGSLLQGRDLLLGDVVLEPCGVAICRLPNAIT